MAPRSAWSTTTCRSSLPGPIGVVVAGLFGLVLGFASLRLGGHYLAMVTISFQQILTLVLTNWIGLTHGPDGISGIARPAGLTSGTGYPQPVPGGAGRVTLYAWRLKTSRLGRAMQAVRDNEIAASTCGIDILRTKVLAFGISAVLGGLGGGLFAGAFAYISPDQFSFAESRSCCSPWRCWAVCNRPSAPWSARRCW